MGTPVIKKHKKSRIIDLVTMVCLYFAAIVGFNDQLNSFALYVFIPAAFVLTILKSGFKLSKSMQWLLFLYVWVAITAINVEFADLAARQMKQILGCILLCYIVLQNANDRAKVPWLYGVYVVLFISFIYYSYTSILGDDFSIETDRLDDEQLNANTLAYFLLYLIIAIFTIGEIVEKSFLKIVFRFAFWLMIPLSFVVAIYTASRQTIVTVIPLLLALLWIRYIKGMNRKKGLFVVLLAVMVVVAVLPRVTEIYEKSYLKQRTEIDLQNDSRILLLKDAVKVGLEHPVFGVGPGNYIRYSYNKHFSHSTYTELLANCGFPGLILYALLVLSFLVVQIKRYRITKDILFLTCIVFGLIYIVDNLFFVFYYDLWLISFFILVSSHSDNYYKQLNAPSA